MKKLLSLLSVLTISGTAVPTTIAASPYQKEETIKNSDINYQETNNLESLKRNKRQTKQPYKKYNILDLSNSSVDIDYDANKYFKSMCKNVLDYLLKSEIIFSIKNLQENILEGCGNNFYVINSNQTYDYFSVRFNVTVNNQISHITLFMTTNSFWLDGFAIGNNYYYFQKSNLQNIDNHNPILLNFEGGYTDLFPTTNPTVQITWSSILNDFGELIRENEKMQNNPFSSNKLRASIGRIILTTSEAMRNRRVRDMIIETYTNNTNYDWRNDFRPMLVDWTSKSRQVIEHLERGYNLGDIENINYVLIFAPILFSHLRQCNNKNKRNLENPVCYNVPIITKSEKKDCSFGGMFFTPVWNNWYRLIPGYDIYHIVECAI